MLDCVTHCQHNKACGAFTFAWGQCYLKATSNGQRNDNNDAVSASCSYLATVGADTDVEDPNATGGGAVTPATNAPVIATVVPATLQTTDAPTTTAFESCTPMPGMAIDGSDVASKPLSLHSEASCEAACLQHESCRFYTFFAPACYLKHSLGKNYFTTHANSADCTGFPRPTNPNASIAVPDDLRAINSFPGDFNARVEDVSTWSIAEEDCPIAMTELSAIIHSDSIFIVGAKTSSTFRFDLTARYAILRVIRVTCYLVCTCGLPPLPLQIVRSMQRRDLDLIIIVLFLHPQVVAESCDAPLRRQPPRYHERREAHLRRRCVPSL